MIKLLVLGIYEKAAVRIYRRRFSERKRKNSYWITVVIIGGGVKGLQATITLIGVIVPEIGGNARGENKRKVKKEE
jgi:hypothetical protein